MIRIRYISDNKLNNLKTGAKIDMLLNHIKNNDIIITDGKLRSRDEAELIRRTMIDLNKDFEFFHGIEIASLQDTSQKNKKVLDIFRKKQKNITIIGPASIISEMRQQPDYVDINLKLKK